MYGKNNVLVMFLSIDYSLSLFTKTQTKKGDMLHVHPKKRSTRRYRP